MKKMFKRATNFNGDISGFETANVTDMGGMLSGRVFNNNGSNSIGNWNTSKVTNMQFFAKTLIFLHFRLF